MHPHAKHSSIPKLETHLDSINLGTHQPQSSFRSGDSPTPINPQNRGVVWSPCGPISAISKDVQGRHESQVKESQNSASRTAFNSLAKTLLEPDSFTSDPDHWSDAIYDSDSSDDLRNSELLYSKQQIIHDIRGRSSLLTTRIKATGISTNIWVEDKPPFEGGPVVLPKRNRQQMVIDEHWNKPYMRCILNVREELPMFLDVEKKIGFMKKEAMYDAWESIDCCWW